MDADNPKPRCGCMLLRHKERKCHFLIAFFFSHQVTSGTQRNWAMTVSSTTRSRWRPGTVARREPCIRSLCTLKSSRSADQAGKVSLPHICVSVCLQGFETDLSPPSEGDFLSLHSCSHYVHRCAFFALVYWATSKSVPCLPALFFFLHLCLWSQALSFILCLYSISAHS